MRRFLALKTIFLESDKGAISMAEPVMDFDSLSEANDWVEAQPQPTIYFIEDQFPDEPEIDMLGSDTHNFHHYEMRSPYVFDDEVDEPFYDNDEISGGDGDAD